MPSRYTWSGEERPWEASPLKLKSGEWGVRVAGPAKFGDVVTVVAKSGKTWTAVVSRVVWSDAADTAVPVRPEATVPVSGAAEAVARWIAMATEIEVEPPRYRLRMTIPAIESLVGAGNRVIPDRHGTYAVVLRRPVPGLTLVLVGDGDEQHRALRLADEPPYPGEWSGGIAWHERGDWVPCPLCGSALVWYEAGYVPGYRVCLKQHHVQLSRDGRSARPTGQRGLDL